MKNNPEKADSRGSGNKAPDVIKNPKRLDSRLNRLGRLNSRKIKDYLYIIFGTALTGAGVALFFTPGKIASGGVNGIATVCYHVFGWDTGFVMLVISVPLFLIGMRIFGPMYGIKSLMGTLLLSAFTTLIGRLTSYSGILAYADRVDTLLSAIFGGLLYGSGIGIVMRSGANTGGTDIVAQIVSRYTPIPVGSSLLIVDGCVIMLGAFAFGLDRAFFAVIAMYVTSQMVNFMVMKIGTKQAKTAYIVSERYHEIGLRIIKELHHGATDIKGTGIFTGRERNMLLAVVHNQQINHLMAIVHEEDPEAFVFVHEAYYALGKGFVKIDTLLGALESEKNAKTAKAAKKAENAKNAKSAKAVKSVKSAKAAKGEAVKSGVAVGGKADSVRMVDGKDRSGGFTDGEVKEKAIDGEA